MPNLPKGGLVASVDARRKEGEMKRTNIQNPKSFTPEELEELLAGIDEELERREGRIKIATREHWQVKRFVSRMIGFLWAKQVEQRPDGICDSPHIQVLERRSTTDLAEQGVDYDRLINDIGHIVEICKGRLEDLKVTLDADTTHAKEEIKVDLGNTRNLSGDAKARVEEHDRNVIAGHRQAKVLATKEKIAAWQAVLKHAEASFVTAKGDKAQAEKMVRSNYSQQAQEHLKWANRKKALKSPFLLPGALSGLPVLDSNEEVETC